MKQLMALSGLALGLLAWSPPLPMAAETNAQALVNCAWSPLLPALPQPQAPYGLANATLVSLWYARNAEQDAVRGMAEANKETNPFSMRTAWMRVIKTSTNDFICAERSVTPFASDQTGEYLALVYRAHIRLDQRMLEVIKNIDFERADAETANQFSSLQVERQERWRDLVHGVGVAFAGLIDLKRTDDPQKTTRLIITKAQKQATLGWIGKNFPEFKDGTPEGKWAEAAKDAHLYFDILKGRKCADE